MYSVVGRVAVLFILAFFGAHVLEAMVWAAGVVGIGAYHVSVGMRTVGLVCTYIVLRDVVKGLYEQGWSGLLHLV